MRVSAKVGPGRWYMAVTPVVVLALGLTACGPAAQDDPTVEPIPIEEPEATTSVEPEPEPEPLPDDEAEVLAVYHAHWDARVAAQRGNPDPTLFADNTVGPLVEEEIAQARMFEQYEIVREGEPEFSQISVNVDGDTAEVTACVDFSTWVVPEAEDDSDSLDVIPSTAVIEQIDGTWFVTDLVGADLVC